MKRDTKNLKQLINKFGFGALEEVLLQHAQTSIRVETTAVENEQALSIGQSKIGGRPDLPKNMDWVTVPSNYGSAYLPFIAQFDLEEVIVHDAMDLLPKVGILYFFADYQLARVVFYTGQKSDLERKAFPEDFPPTPPHESPEYRYDPCAVTFIPEVNLPFDIPDIEYPKAKRGETFMISYTQLVIQNRIHHLQKTLIVCLVSLMMYLKICNLIVS